MNHGIKVLKKFLNKLKKMNDDEFKEWWSSHWEEVSLSQEIFDRFFKELKRKKQIDSEDLLYFPEKFKITEKELYLVVRYIEHFIYKHIFKIEIDNKNPFPNSTCFIKYKKTIFSMFCMSGQGTIHIFSIEDNKDFNIITKIDETIKFEVRK